MDMYFVYFLTNKTNRVLYIGVTRDLKRRYHEHKSERVEGFTKRYHVHKLVYYEVFHDPLKAIEREKQLKGWRREKKNNLICKKKIPNGWIWQISCLQVLEILRLRFTTLRMSSARKQMKVGTEILRLRFAPLRMTDY